VIKLGQELFFVPSTSGRLPCLVEITKIGRKWAELNNGYRINTQTLRADGRQYTSPGRCYLCQEAWEAEKARIAAWEVFSSKIGRLYVCPSNVTLEQIEQASRLLGLSNAAQGSKAA
jgi:hypothetical protein